MIRLKSAPSDAALKRLNHCERKRAEALAQGRPVPLGVLNGYRHDDVKSAVLAETCGKCAYCEARITHVYFGDVEHIVPKSSDEAGRFDYDNLTLACAQCNNKKSDYYNAEQPLLNPYADDVASHLMGAGTLIWEADNSDLGRRTKKLLALNRLELLERRHDALEDVARIAREYLLEPEGALRDALLEELKHRVDRCAEYSLVVSGFLRGCYRSVPFETKDS